MVQAVQIRPMTSSDLPAVARVHQAAFKGFFLDQMGPPFLRRYYATVMDYPNSLSLVAVDAEDEVVAFAAGFIDPAAFYAHFRERRLSFIPAVALALLRQPSLLGRILDNSRRVKSIATPGPDVGELASIGVEGKGGGVGSLLLGAFCDQMFARGASRVILTTDDADNASTQAFYERRGFRHVGEETRGSRVLRRYERAPA
jgi:ribosomal protein S18 acetylase RimI-like enzyme